MQIEIDRGKSCINHGYIGNSMWFIRSASTRAVSTYVSMPVEQFQREMETSDGGLVSRYYSSFGVHDIMPHIRGVVYSQVVWCLRIYALPQLTAVFGREDADAVRRNNAWLTSTRAGRKFRRMLVSDCKKLCCYISGRWGMYAD